jgi:hypothetical protein
LELDNSRNAANISAELTIQDLAEKGRHQDDP